MARETQAVLAAADSEWLDEMVKNLKDELQSQLNRVRQASPKPEEDEAKMRASDARTLAALERTLERLSKLERERAAVREKKISPHDGQARTALERRLDKRLAAAAKADGAGKPQRG